MPDTPFSVFAFNSKGSFTAPERKLKSSSTTSGVGVGIGVGAGVVGCGVTTGVGDAVGLGLGVCEDAGVAVVCGVGVAVVSGGGSDGPVSLPPHPVITKDNKPHIPTANQENELRKGNLLIGHPAIRISL